MKIKNKYLLVIRKTEIYSYPTIKQRKQAIMKLENSDLKFEKMKIYQPVKKIIKKSSLFNEFKFWRIEKEK